MIDLSGKVALITGSSRGIGQACAIEMARAGADICVNYRSHPAEADEVAAEIRDLGRIAMLACIFGCDALFEDGYVAVLAGVIIGTPAVASSSAIGRRIAEIAGRKIEDYEASAQYFEWHYEHIFRGQDT